MGESVRTDYMRQVDKHPAPYCYIKLQLEYEGKGFETNPLQFKHIVMQALTQVFGQIGASDTVDLLKLSSSGVALLRVPSSCFVRLWGALTLFGKYNDDPCAFRVNQVSTNLISLACNSRQWHIPLVSST